MRDDDGKYLSSMTGGDLLAEVLRCTELNSTLSGDSLMHAADALFALADSDGACVASVDDAGARIVGVALTRHDTLRTVDRSRRSDGLHVLLVAGYTAGPFHVAHAAHLMRAAGAATVDAAVLQTVSETMTGCDHVTVLPAGPLRAVAAS